MKQFITLCAAVAAVSAFALPPGATTAAAGKKDAAAVDQKAQVENRANRMIKNAIALFEGDEADRAVGMLEAVGRMYPESQARFRAHLELGRHFLDKREFDRAIKELRAAFRGDDPDLRAESLFLEGKVHVARGQGGDAVMALRRITLDYPASAFANDAFFLLGQIHFDAKRWTRATEAFQMVGTAVPASVSTNEAVLVEAGQRVFAHVYDKDLAVIQHLGGKSYVEFSSAGGDRERVLLKPFGKGDGDFLAEVATTTETSQPNDGKLTVHGAERVGVRYVDANTEDGRHDHAIDATAEIVSSASITFTDGAGRQRVKGMFVDQPAFLRLNDLDLDVTENADAITLRLTVQFRERPEIPPGADPNAPPPPPPADAPWITRGECDVALKETGPRTGVFTGRIVPRLMPAGCETNRNVKIDVKPGEILVCAEDRVRVEYVDKKHLSGTKPIDRYAEAQVLVGGSTEPQSIVSYASEASVQARKLLIEAQLLYKWGSIFKDVGLDSNAKSKAEEGLKRVSDLLGIAAKNSLERDVLEGAYEARWNLLLLEGRLQEAIDTCRALVKRCPDTILADRAFMQIANARREEKADSSLTAAIQIYGGIIGLENSPLKAEAQFRIGEVHEELARRRYAASTGANRKLDFSAAMMAFRRCAEAYPTSSFAGESYKRVVDYYISIRDYQRAKETLERVFEDFPDAPWLDDMLLKWGVVCHRLGDKTGAMEKFRRIVEEYPGGNSAKKAASFIQKLDRD